MKNLQQNLGRIIKEQNLSIIELEKKSGLKKNSVYNIIKGISKNPSSQNLLSIAKTLGVTMEILYKETNIEKIFLSEQQLNLINKASQIIISEIIDLNLKVSFAQYLELLNKMFEYNANDDGDANFKFANCLLLNLKQQN